MGSILEVLLYKHMKMQIVASWTEYKFGRVKVFFFSFVKSIKQSSFIVGILFVLLCWGWMIFTGYLGMQIDKLQYCCKKSCHILTTRRLFKFLLPTKRKLCCSVVSLLWSFDYFYTKLFKIISTQNHNT